MLKRIRWTRQAFSWNKPRSDPLRRMLEFGSAFGEGIDPMLVEARETLL